MAPSILALDLSLTSTGWAAGRMMPAVGLIKQGKLRDWERVANIVNEIKEMAAWVDMVAIEAPAYKAQGGGSVHTFGLGDIVRFELWKQQKPVVDVNLTHIKMFATGKGNAQKAEMVAEACRRLGYQGHSEDECDALWLWHMAMAGCGNPQVELPKLHTRALDSYEWPEIRKAVRV